MEMNLCCLITEQLIILVPPDDFITMVTVRKFYALQLIECHDSQH